MKRRDVLKWQLYGMLWLVGGAPVALQSGAALAAPPDVVVARSDPKNPARAARAAVDALGGMGRFVRAGNKVLIKPNMSFARGVDSATTTHPDIVREVLVMCKEAGAATVRVLDHSLHDAEQSLQRSGILAACDSVVDNDGTADDLCARAQEFLVSMRAKDQKDEQALALHLAHLWQ